MLKSWMKVFPFFMIEWFAKRNCEKFFMNGDNYSNPFEGVFIRELED